jgi:hypothetical protein
VKYFGGFLRCYGDGDGDGDGGARLRMLLV